MKFIRIAERNAQIHARCANCFDLIDARTTPPDLMLLGLGGKRNPVEAFYHRPGETDQQLWDRVVRSATAMHLAGDGRRPKVTCLYADEVGPVWFPNPLIALSQ